MLEQKIKRIFVVGSVLTSILLGGCSPAHTKFYSTSGEITYVEYCKTVNHVTKKCVEYGPTVFYGGE